jgi:CDP-glucose 4,6-dehydratase
VVAAEPDGKPESTLLALDSSRARAILGWRPALDIAEAARLTAEWYRAAREGGDMLAITRAQIADYRAATARRPT